MTAEASRRLLLEKVQNTNTAVDWWLYKEHHLAEKYFLKLKAFRRIATRYDKLPFTYLGFICLASINYLVKMSNCLDFSNML